MNQTDRHHMKTYYKYTTVEEGKNIPLSKIGMELYSSNVDWLTEKGYNLDELETAENPLENGDIVRIVRGQSEILGYAYSKNKYRIFSSRKLFLFKEEEYKCRHWVIPETNEGIVAGLKSILGTGNHGNYSFTEKPMSMKSFNHNEVYEYHYSFKVDSGD